MNPLNIIIHHSLTADGQMVNWQAIRKYHIETNGWKDIGYHYGIENVYGQYEILKGRFDNMTGAHAKGFNQDSIGICLIGNYDDHEPLPIQLDLLQRLVISLITIYGIKVANVLGHRETYARLGKPQLKICPGRLFDMIKFRKSLLL